MVCGMELALLRRDALGVGRRKRWCVEGVAVDPKNAVRRELQWTRRGRSEEGPETKEAEAGLSLRLLRGRHQDVERVR